VEKATIRCICWVRLDPFLTEKNRMQIDSAIPHLPEHADGEGLEEKRREEWGKKIMDGA
jgi:hypothetical protein